MSTLNKNLRHSGIWNNASKEMWESIWLIKIMDNSTCLKKTKIIPALLPHKERLSPIKRTLGTISTCLLLWIVKFFYFHSPCFSFSLFFPREDMEECCVKYKIIGLIFYKSGWRPDLYMINTTSTTATGKPFASTVTFQSYFTFTHSKNYILCHDSGHINILIHTIEIQISWNNTQPHYVRTTQIFSVLVGCFHKCWSPHSQCFYYPQMVHDL